MSVISKAAIRRDPSVSTTRLIAMVLIVTCHFFQYFGLELAWWFNVGVQVFFFLSGFLYGGKSVDFSADFFAKNFKKLLIPYYCFLIPIVALYMLLSPESLTRAALIRAFFCCGTIKGIEHLWFISYILFCYLLTPYVAALTQNLRKLKPLFFLCAAASILLIGQIVFILLDSFYLFSRVTCYLLGYFCAVFRDQYGTKYFNVIRWLCVGTTVIANGIRIYYKYILHAQFFAFDYFTQYAHVLLGASIALLLFACPARQSGILNLSDRYSYYIYLVHQFFILSPFSLLDTTQNVWINCFLTLFAICCSATLLKFVSDKVFICVNRTEQHVKNLLYG